MGLSDVRRILNNPTALHGYEKRENYVKQGSKRLRNKRLVRATG